MAKLIERKNKTLFLEYKQEKKDKDYGSCYFAKFIFDLDEYELRIVSACGDYIHKWHKSSILNTKQFLDFLSKIDCESFLKGIYGSANIFSYDATKRNIYGYYATDKENRIKLDKIFRSIESVGIPFESYKFVKIFEQKDIDKYFNNIWELVKTDYPKSVLTITSIFMNYIQPYINKNINNKKETKT